MDFQITALHPEDWAAVREVYREGIATGNATFETELPDWEKWDGAHRQDCRLVACESVDREPGRAVAVNLHAPPLHKGAVIGFAALSPVSSRRAYAGVAEVSVYVAASARGRGIGRALLQALVSESEGCGMWTLQAGIFPENVASIALHKSCGFREVGVRHRIARLGETWRDVLLLERRSAKVD
jgi:L-amino acid N-acyltransferase YncA